MDDMTNMTSEDFLKRDDVIPVVIGGPTPKGQTPEFTCSKCREGVDISGSSAPREAIAHPNAIIFCSAHGEEYMDANLNLVGTVQAPPEMLKSLGAEAGHPVSQRDIQNILNLRRSAALVSLYMEGRTDDDDS